MTAYPHDPRPTLRPGGVSGDNRADEMIDQPQADPSGWRRIATSGRIPVLRTSYHLFATTGLNAAIGVVYWISAARLYPADVVGAGGAAVSAVFLLSSVGFIGLQYVVMRYVPLAGRRSASLVVATYAIACLIAVSAATLFVVGFAAVAGLRFVRATPLLGVAFVGGVALWTVFSLQDAVLIALRQSRWVPVENACYGLLKLALVAVLADASSPWVLLGTWLAATAPFILLVNALLWSRRASVHRRSTLPPPRRLVRLSAGQHAIGVFAALPDFLVPLLVLGLLTSEATAYYFAAWNVSLSLRLLAVNMASALTVEGAHAGEQVWRLLRVTGRLAATVLVPLVVLLVIAAPAIMRIFGRRYGAEGAAPLRLLAVGLIPYTVIVLAVAVERVRERTASALFITGLTAALTIALAVVLIPAIGIDGAGLAWVLAQVAGAVTALATLVAGRRPPRAGKRIR